MRVAQRLYENGYITYMRTDSTTLSESALTAARKQARELYGADSSRTQPRRYDAQGEERAGGARGDPPGGRPFRTPEELGASSTATSSRSTTYLEAHARLADGGRARADGVGPARRDDVARGRDAEFRRSGTVITFRGFLAAYEEGRDDDAERRGGAPLPHLAAGRRACSALELEPEGHATTPPARYTEATLVQALEERGIGRPSTYASILGTILDRGYVFKRGTALVPTFLAFAVTQLLEQHFERLVDYDFTARMEDDLDRIAAGEEERVDWLQRFYFGGGGRRRRACTRSSPTSTTSTRARSTRSRSARASSLRVGRYGPYLERGDERASVPDDLRPTS